MKVRLTKMKKHVLVQLIHSRTVVATYKAEKVVIDGHNFWLQEGQVDLWATKVRYVPGARKVEIETAHDSSKKKDSRSAT